MPRRRVLAGNLLLVLILGYALSLHFAEVAEQLLVDDELHALKAAREHSFLGIFSFYAPGDNSIPMTLYAKLLMTTVGLTELRLRAPIMVADVLMLLAPLLFARKLGRAVTFASIALIATSPMVVHYSIVARPYTPSALFVLLTVACWDRWLSSKSRTAMWLTALSGASAVFFHLLAVVPLAALLIPTLLEVRARRILLTDLVKVVLATIAASLVLLGPGIPGLLEHRLNKVGEGPELWVSMKVSYRLLVGHLPVAAWIFPPLFALGTWRLCRRGPGLQLALPLLVLAQLAGLYLIQPMGTPGVFARYIYLVWPLALIVAAAGLEGLVVWITRACVGPEGREGAGALAELPVVVLAVVLASLVPLASPAAVFHLGASSYRTSKSSLNVIPPTKRLRPVMAAIADDPAERVVLLGLPLPSWDLVNGYKKEGLLERRVKLATFRASIFRSSGIFLRNEVSLRAPDELRATGARHLIVHRRSSEGSTLRMLESDFGPPVLSDGVSRLFAVTGD